MSSELAQFLRHIPQSNQDAQPLEAVLPGVSPEFLRGAISVLKTLGAVKMDAEGRIQASSQTAKYFLMSLASYAESEVPIVEEWRTRGVYPDGTRNPLQNAATLLHAIETRRSALLPEAPAVRNEQVAQVLIKRTNPQTGKGELLFQFDSNAKQYQLIGGRRKDSDPDLRFTMIREIEEELADDLQHAMHYQLECIISGLQLPPIISPTFGALTSYRFEIFHMTGLQQALKLQPEDVWVPISQVLSGYVIDDDGHKIPFSADDLYQLMNSTLHDGFEGLASSFASK